MNSNFIIVILLLLVFYLYFNKGINTENKKNMKSLKINPKDFNPAIHHPAAL
jgi:hypothetical protein